MKRRQKAVFVTPRSSKIIVTNEKERTKRKSEEKEKKEKKKKKKAMVALLVFITEPLALGRKPQTAKCYVTTALRSPLQFAVHV